MFYIKDKLDLICFVEYLNRNVFFRVGSKRAQWTFKNFTEP